MRYGAEVAACVFVQESATQGASARSAILEALGCRALESHGPGVYRGAIGHGNVARGIALRAGRIGFGETP